MSVTVPCPTCGRPFTGPDNAAKLKISCPQCRAQFLTGAPPQAKPVATAPPSQARPATSPPVQPAPLQQPAAQPDGARPRILLALGAGLLLVCALAVTAVVAWRAGVRSATTAAPTTAGAATDLDKEAFLELVRQHAADPTGLEIIEWSPLRHGENGAAFRTVKFRCKLIAYSTAVVRAPRQPASAAGVPILVDGGEIAYQDGKLQGVLLMGAYTHWHAKK